MSETIDKSAIDPKVWEALSNAFTETVLPRVRQHARAQFSRLRGDNLDDAIAKAEGNAWKAYITLHRNGQNPDEFPSRIADFAVRHVKAHRDVTGQEKQKDVLSRRHGRGVESLPLDDQHRPDLLDGLADTRRMTPADAAGFRIDYESWPAREKGKERERIDDLATGLTTTEAAVKHGVSESAVSQWRTKARRNWEEYQGEKAR